MVRTSFANCAGNCRSARGAGPDTTAPDVLNREPWHGQTKVWLLYPVMVQASCVQVAVKAAKVVAAVRATRRSPDEVRSNAALPTSTSGDEGPIVTVATPPCRLALTCGSGAPTEGDVGLPPQPCSAVPMPAMETA